MSPHKIFIVEPDRLNNRDGRLELRFDVRCMRCKQGLCADSKAFWGPKAKRHVVFVPPCPVCTKELRDLNELEVPVKGASREEGQDEWDHGIPQSSLASSAPTG